MGWGLVFVIVNILMNSSGIGNHPGQALFLIQALGLNAWYR
jgi:hypothetical protein